MDQRSQSPVVIGKGVYSVAEAARLADIPAARISRWLRGRQRVYRGENVFDPPLWVPELPDIDGVLHLTFRD